MGKPWTLNPKSLPCGSLAQETCCRLGLFFHFDPRNPNAVETDLWLELRTSTPDSLLAPEP